MLRRGLLPDLAGLQTFECAARHGNFSRAGQELNLTQSAVSRQIKELEARVGHDLFARVRQRVILSDAGARLLPEVRRLLAEAEKLMIGTLGAGQRSLRIGTLPTFGARWLVPRLGDFQRLHPGIALTVESRDRPFSFDDDPLDLSIHYGRPVWPGAVATFLCNEAVLPVAGRALAADLGLTGPADLVRAPLLHLTGRPGLWADWCDARGVAGINAYAGLRFDQFSMVISAVLAGLGVGLLPSYLIERETRSGDLVALSAEPLPTEAGYFVMVPEGRQAHPGAVAFRDWILGQVGR